MAGFYLMHRGWQDNPVFRDEPFSRRDAFVWLIENALYVDGRFHGPKGWIELKRGQVCASLRYLAAAWKWDDAKVRRFLASAVRAEIFDAATDAGQTVITIRNYDKYQSLAERPDAGDAASLTRDRRGGDANIKKDKEDNELITPPTPPAPGGEVAAEPVGRDGKPYAFCGDTIRLNQADFDQWSEFYSAIPDLRAALKALDDWFRTAPPEKRKGWFHITSSNLQRKHDECLAKQQEAHASNPLVFDYDRMDREQLERDRLDREETERRRQDGLRYLADKRAREAAAGQQVH